MCPCHKRFYCLSLLQQMSMGKSEKDGARDGKTLSYVPTKESIQKYLQDANVEILVLVEGYDPTTSCNVQRNASYTSNDIMWNHKFVPCVSRTNREVVVDMNAFHKTMKLT